MSAAASEQSFDVLVAGMVFLDVVFTELPNPPAPGTEDEWIAQARTHFAGDVVFGEDLTTVTVG